VIARDLPVVNLHGDGRSPKALTPCRHTIPRTSAHCYRAAPIVRGLEMINRRRAFCFAFIALSAGWLLQSSKAGAQQAFQRYFPFLVDLDGWQGKKPDGVSMEMPGNSMITAAREYQRGAAHLHAQILFGMAAKGALAATQTGMNIETSDGRMNTSTIDGMTVTRTFNFKDKSGAILVALGANGLLSVSFNGIPDDEALTLAKKFDWKAIQAAQPKS
jgi:hypothetical protein